MSSGHHYWVGHFRHDCAWSIDLETSFISENKCDSPPIKGSKGDKDQHRLAQFVSNRERRSPSRSQTVPPSADRQYPLAATTAAPRVRRSVCARDYTLPKPYRRKKFVEDAPDRSRLRVALLSCSGLALTSLITALAMLAKENLEAPPITIIAAQAPPPAARPSAAAVTAQLANFVAPQVAASSAVDPVRAPHPRPRPKVAPAPKLARIAHAAAQPVGAAPDPDVVLISAILALTPPPEPDEQVQADP
jgi:hypothetical protein